MPYIRDMTKEEFKEWRKRLGWTQTQAGLPEALDIHRNTVLGYEKGTYPIPRTVELACFYLAEEYGVPKYLYSRGVKA